MFIRFFIYLLIAFFVWRIIRNIFVRPGGREQVSYSRGESIDNDAGIDEQNIEDAKFKDINDK